MIVKIFKISTKEMFTFKNKYELYAFVKANTNTHPGFNTTIAQLIRYLPVEDYYRVT